MIPEYAPRQEYIGDGTLYDYTFDFKIADLTHLLIVVSDSAGVESIRVRGDDVVSLTGVVFDSINGGGTVSLLTPLALNDNLAILLANDAPLQESEFKDKGFFTLSRFESALDALAGQIQRLAYRSNRSLKAAETTLDATVTAVNWEIPSPVGNAGKTLTVNATEDGFEWV